MQDHLKVAFIQSELVWESPKQNRQNFEKVFTAPKMQIYEKVI